MPKPTEARRNAEARPSRITANIMASAVWIRRLKITGFGRSFAPVSGRGQTHVQFCRQDSTCFREEWSQVDSETKHPEHREQSAESLLIARQRHHALPYTRGERL